MDLQKHSLSIGLLAVVLGLLGVFLFMRGQRDLEGPEGVQRITADDAGRIPGPAEGPGLPAKRVDTSSEAPGEGPPVLGDKRGSLDVRVLWYDGTPAVKVGGNLCRERSKREVVQSFVTDEEGRFSFGWLEPGAVQIQLDRGVYRKVAIVAGAHEEVTIEIPRGNDVVGKVIDALGRPVERAAVSLSHNGEGWPAGAVANTDAGGNFFVRSASARRCFVSATAPHYAPSRRYVLPAGTGYIRELEIVLNGRVGGSLLGWVRNSEGRGVAGAAVLVGSRRSFDPTVRTANGIETLGPEPLSASTDGLGAFRLEGVLSGVMNVEVLAPGFAPWNGDTEILPGQERRLEIELTSGSLVEGIIRNPDGKELPGVGVAWVSETTFRKRSTETRADGTYELSGLPVGAFELLVVMGGEVLVNERLHGEPGVRLSWNPIVDAGAVIRGKLDAPGMDCTALMVSCLVPGPNGGALVGMQYADADGTFEFPNCEDTAHTLRVSYAAQPMVAIANLEGVYPEKGLAFVTVEALPSSRLKGRVLDQQGQPATGIDVAPLGGEAMTTFLTRTNIDGTFDIGPLPEGTWSLQVWGGGMSLLLTTEAVRLDSGQIYDFGELYLP